MPDECAVATNIYEDNLLDNLPYPKLVCIFAVGIFLCAINNAE